jgi:hypothetical protein
MKTDKFGLIKTKNSWVQNLKKFNFEKTCMETLYKYPIQKTIIDNLYGNLKISRIQFI